LEQFLNEMEKKLKSENVQLVPKQHCDDHFVIGLLQNIYLGICFSLQDKHIVKRNREEYKLVKDVASFRNEIKSINGRITDQFGHFSAAVGQFLTYVESWRIRKGTTIPVYCSEDQYSKFVEDLKKDIKNAPVEVAQKFYLQMCIVPMIRKCIDQEILNFFPRPTLKRSFTTERISNCWEFFAYSRLFNRSQKRKIQNMKEKNNDALCSVKKVDFRLIRFKNTQSKAKENQIISSKEHSRIDKVDQLGSYEQIPAFMENMKQGLNKEYPQSPIDDRDFVKWIRDCLTGNGLKFDPNISLKHQKKLVTLLLI